MVPEVQAVAKAARRGLVVETAHQGIPAVRGAEAFTVGVTGQFITVQTEVRVLAQSELFGPAQLVASHQRIQETCNA